MKTLFAVLAITLLSAGSLLAADAKQPKPAAPPKQEKTAAAPAANKAWFESTLKSMKTRVSGKFHSSGARAGAVAAVRGSKIGEDANKTYWKGGISDKAAKKLEAEKAEFAAGLELAVSGKNDEAIAAFQKFLTDNPGSSLTIEVKDALSKLTGTGAAEVPASSTTASAPAQPPATDKK